MVSVSSGYGQCKFRVLCSKQKPNSQHRQRMTPFMIIFRLALAYVPIIFAISHDKINCWHQIRSGWWMPEGLLDHGWYWATVQIKQSNVTFQTLFENGVTRDISTSECNWKNTMIWKGRLGLVLLLGIFRRAPCPSDTRECPCALLLPRGHPAP
jgi:hypothetical protein